MTAPPAAAASVEAAPRAFRHAGSGFSAKFDAFLQDRLRVFAAILAVIAAVALAGMAVQYAIYRLDALSNFVRDPMTWFIAGVLVVMSAAAAALRGTRRFAGIRRSPARVAGTRSPISSTSSR